MSLALIRSAHRGRRLSRWMLPMITDKLIISNQSKFQHSWFSSNSKAALPVDKQKVQTIEPSEPVRPTATKLPAINHEQISTTTNPKINPAQSNESAIPSTFAKSSTPPKTTAAHFNRQQIRRDVRSYLFDRYMNYIKNYDQVLEKKFPAAMKVYRVFTVGIRDFYLEMKQFLKITRIVHTSSQGLRALTRRELEIYYQMPKDMLRVAPVLALSALPFANYVIFPLAYMFPKHLLSPHFWSMQQRYQFSTDMLQDRLRYQRHVFRFMQSKLDSLRDDDRTNFEKMRHVLGRLGSGQHPTVDEIKGLDQILSESDYSFQSLPHYHLSHLCRLHGIHSGIRKCQRLAYHAFVVHHMDLAIRREGGVHNMPAEAMRKACALRGLNTADLNTDEQIDWLRQWVELSSLVDGNNVSLFMYLPVLLTYNHPNNWKLLYDK